MSHPMEGGGLSEAVMLIGHLEKEKNKLENRLFLSSRLIKELKKVGQK